ncbi:transcriptional regulator, DeoR family [Lachnospiraceae bacterium KM106-2]|nr:transcriptional regulator, DeoR family [Lachnospiraceae bacterium KM106-2]
MDHYSIDRSVFTDEEQKKILMALESIQATKQIDVEESLLKLRGLFQKRSSNWVEIDFYGWEQSEEHKALFSLLRDCILSDHAVSFLYTDLEGKETERIVEPVKLIFKGYNWYLYGYCRMRKDYRIFKLVRMQQVKKTEELVEDKTREAMPQQLQKRFNKDDLVEVELLIKGKNEFRVYDEFRAGYIEKTDKGIYVRVKLPNNDWLYGYLIGFGTSMEVLGPDWLRERIKEELMKIVKKYLEPDS